MRQRMSLLAVIALAIGLVMGGTGATATAATKTAGTFYLQAQLPKQQRQRQLTYFRLTLAPKAQVTLPVVVGNQSAQPLRISLHLNPATTNANGLISYDQPHMTASKPTPPTLDQLVTGPRQQTVTLAPGAKQRVTFTVRMPVKRFSGMILGGITAAATVGPTTGPVRNRVQYVKGVVLMTTAAQPAVNLSAGSAAVKMVGNRPTLSMPLKNQTATLLGASQAVTTIYHQGRPVQRLTQTGFQVAPLSQFEYQRSIKSLSPGKYRVVVQIKGPRQFEQQVSSTFVVKAGQLETVQQRQAKRQQQQLLWGLILIGVVVVIGLIGGAFWRGRRSS